MDFLPFLINESARHGEQMRDGGWVTRQGPITTERLRAHQAGALRLATPVVADDGTCRFLALDDDGLKRVPETEEIARRRRERAVRSRRLVEMVVRPDAILTIETGGDGWHLVVLLNGEPVDLVGPVATALRAIVGLELGELPEKFEGFPSTTSSPVTGGHCRLLSLPGLYVQRHRWSRIQLQNDEFVEVSRLTHLDLHPLSHDEFGDLCNWAAAQQSSVDRWIGDRNRIRAERAQRVLEHRNRELPFVPPVDGLPTVTEFCSAFAGAVAELLDHAGIYSQSDAVFVASVAGAIPGALSALRSKIVGMGTYAGILEDLANRQEVHQTPAMSCRAAQLACLCPHDCAARMLAGNRSPADLHTANRVWLRERLSKDRGMSLAQARHELQNAALREVATSLTARWGGERRGNGGSD